MSADSLLELFDMLPFHGDKITLHIDAVACHPKKWVLRARVIPPAFSRSVYGVVVLPFASLLVFLSHLLSGKNPPHLL